MIWYNDEINIKENLDNENYDEMIEYSKKNLENIISRFVIEDISESRKTLQFGSMILRDFEAQINDQRELSIFLLGSLMGAVKGFERIFHEKRQEELSEKMFQSIVSNVKHLDKIILALATYGSLNHRELCNTINLDEYTLIKIMKQIQPYHLIMVQKSGKHTYYMLSDEGKIYSRQLKNK